MTICARTVEHLVIGGGPAGAMAAVKLAEAGRGVTLLEKEARPLHKVCGEFLSREAIEYLRGISVFPADLGAQAIRQVRLSSKTKIAEAVLPFPALSLSRRVLDEAMLARAAAAGCQVRRGVAVEQLSRNDNGWSVRLANQEVITARKVLLASGKHDLRGWKRAPGSQNDLVGFKLHWRLRRAEIAALREYIELFLFSGGYGGLSLLEEETANLCIVVRRSKLRQTGDWWSVLAAILAESVLLRRRLDGAEPLQAQPLAIAPIPYGYLAQEAKGVWRVGDQAAVIPSFTGDGISIALHSASLAAEFCLAGATPDAYLHTLRGQLRNSMRLATGLSRLMVTSPGRAVAPVALSLLPGILRWVAASTRIPAGVLLRRDSAHTCTT